MDAAETVKPKVLIVGTEGMLGGVLVSELSKNFTVAGTTERDLDITDGAKALHVCRYFQPRVIILAAAYTDVDGCEKNPQLAYAVNAQGAKNIAQAASKVGAALVFISTDYVFDGKSQRPYLEEDDTLPVSVYGKSKLQGEQNVQSILEKSVIVRSCWLFGSGHKGFIPYILEAMKEEKPLAIVGDKMGSPTHMADLSSGIGKIIHLIMENRHDFSRDKILHIVNSGICSWYDMAEYVLKFFNRNDIALKKLNLDEYPFAAQRPRFSALDKSKFERLTGMYLRSWQDALKEFLQCHKS